ILDEAYPQLDWKISDDTLTIGGYNCQKATVSFKGRTYTAWFSPELPFSFGPWKLHGLPGLILDVADSKKEVVFHFVGFEKLDHVNLQIGDRKSTRLNSSHVKISYAVFCLKKKKKKKVYHTTLP